LEFIFSGLTVQRDFDMDLRNRLFGSLFRKKEIPSPTNSDTESEMQEDLESSTNSLKDYWMRDDKVLPNNIGEGML
jgi:hypothetical protein